MALPLLRKAATRPSARASAVKGARQERARGGARTSGSRRHGTLEAAGCQGEDLDTGSEEAARLLCGHVGGEALGQEAHYVAMRPGDMAHGGTRLRERKAASLHSAKCYIPRALCVLTQSGAKLGVARYQGRQNYLPPQPSGRESCLRVSLYVFPSSTPTRTRAAERSAPTESWSRSARSDASSYPLPTTDTGKQLLGASLQLLIAHWPSWIRFRSREHEIHKTSSWHASTSTGIYVHSSQIFR
jgi:hypothetical protein